MFRVHSICVKNVFKACYSVFNSGAKGVSINCRNMACCAFFQFWQSPLAFSIDTIFQESPQLEVTEIQVRRIRVPGSPKSSRTYPIISKLATKQMPGRQCEWRTILHEDKVSKHSRSSKAGMTYAAEEGRCNGTRNEHH
ncbi:hypothetical protein AVEN_122411-1 [Araneus ventricosus]|uniref:Uncharacterized protein n=1 Tax=Araneus ventricosus TaxID=182803 RepID=A0A4Y2L0Q2_ARAVE|nr:hypothetical protein AVEN_122411-1 [Araneus ventricosus]